MSKQVLDLLATKTADRRSDPTALDALRQHLTPRDCDMALRLTNTLLKAGLMEEAEAADWKARLFAWKAAHTMEPAEA